MLRNATECYGCYGERQHLEYRGRVGLIAPRYMPYSTAAPHSHPITNSAARFGGLFHMETAL